MKTVWQRHKAGFLLNKYENLVITLFMQMRNEDYILILLKKNLKMGQIVELNVFSVGVYDMGVPK
ncbi:hypothetical protein [Polaromonas sp.]|uniref:hypothetical protein n=1 Tax=Polaromonas sp. TaxID=1869339 RepID=UPI003569A3E3